MQGVTRLFVGYLPLYQRCVINSHQPYTKECRDTPQLTYHQRCISGCGYRIIPCDKLRSLRVCCLVIDNNYCNLRVLGLDSSSVVKGSLSHMTNLQSLHVQHGIQYDLNDLTKLTSLKTLSISRFSNHPSLPNVKIEYY